jgi:hypothetical protein
MFPSHQDPGRPHHYRNHKLWNLRTLLDVSLCRKLIRKSSLGDRHVLADVFDAIADSLDLTGIGRDAAKDFLTAEVGTLTAAAKRHGISRPAVARQVKRMQAAADDDQIDVTLTLSLAELEAIFKNRQQGFCHPKLIPDTIVSRAERLLCDRLTVPCAATKGASFYCSPDHLLIVDRQRSSAIHVWTSQSKLSNPFQHAEIEILSTVQESAETKPPAYESLCRLGLVTDPCEHWTYLRIHSLNALKHLISDFVTI